jgi:hypothetical protein
MYIGVPVKFTQSLGLEFDDGGSDRLRNRKVARIDPAECSTVSRDRLRVMLIGMENIGRVPPESALGCFLSILTDGAVEDVWEFRGDLVEGVGADAEVLG